MYQYPQIFSSGIYTRTSRSCWSDSGGINLEIGTALYWNIKQLAMMLSYQDFR